MFVHLRLMRLRGGLSCVQIIVVILAHFACWTALDHSHEVDNHFKPPLCILMRSMATSSHIFALSMDRRPLQSIFFADFLSHPTPTYIHYILASVHPSIHPSIHRSIIRSSTHPCESLQLCFGWRVGLVQTAPMFNMFMKKRFRSPRL